MIARLKVLQRPESLSDRVYATLREYLRAGRVPIGQPLAEAALAAQLGVSRTPVREALARLAADGLLVSDGRSFTVPMLSDSDVEDIYALRFLLEPEALREIGAARPSRKTLAPLRSGTALAATDRSTSADRDGARRRVPARTREGIEWPS